MAKKVAKRPKNRSHKRMLRRIGRNTVEVPKCKICGLKVRSSLKAHLQGMHHRNKVAKMQGKRI